MKRLTFLIATATVTAAASSSLATGAEVEVLNDGFGNLAGRDRLNHSVPPGADASGADDLLATIGEDALPAEWRQWGAGMTVEGEGPFAFRYLGDPAALGHVGPETMRVVTAVPEPAGLLVLASSLGVIGLMQRRERH